MSRDRPDARESARPPGRWRSCNNLDYQPVSRPTPTLDEKMASSKSWPRRPPSCALRLGALRRDLAEVLAEAESSPAGRAKSVRLRASRFGETSRRSSHAIARERRRMAGPTRLELATSGVTAIRLQVLSSSSNSGSTVEEKPRWQAPAVRNQLFSSRRWIRSCSALQMGRP
jgi:hypothetical protein